MKIQNVQRRKGSSTVLVILMIVLLISLSVLSVSVSNSGYKLSKRMGEQFQGYYLLESEADRCYSRLAALGGDGVTVEKMLEIGCRNPKIEENICSFSVEKDGRHFVVAFDIRDNSLKSWYEKERVFEIKPIEISTFE